MANALATSRAKHYMRYLRASEGESLEEIAATEGVGLKAVEKSIREIKLQREMNNATTLNSAVIGMLMGNITKVDKGFNELFQAKNYVERRLPDGSSELVPVPDSDTRLEALKTFGKFVESVQPKGSGSTINVTQQNANNAAVTNIRHGGFVDRLKEIRKRVDDHNLLPPITVDAIEEDPDDEDEDEE